jgi:hypothetical protein
MTTGPDWAEQARRLLESLRTAPTGEQPTGQQAGGEQAAGEHGSGECRWCPHCQVNAVLRGDRPEVTAVLADVLTTAVAALRHLAGEPPVAEPAPSAEQAAAAPTDPAPVVQRIEIA